MSIVPPATVTVAVAASLAKGAPGWAGAIPAIWPLTGVHATDSSANATTAQMAREESWRSFKYASFMGSLSLSRIAEIEHWVSVAASAILFRQSCRCSIIQPFLSSAHRANSPLPMLGLTCAPVAQLDRAAASEGAYRVDNKALDGIATDLK